MMVEGTYIGTIVAPPATTLLNAPQYLTGRVLGDAAAVYIPQGDLYPQQDAVVVLTTAGKIIAFTKNAHRGIGETLRARHIHLRATCIARMLACGYRRVKREPLL